jgi:hypothetical protein
VIDSLSEVGRYCEMEINMQNIYSNENLKATVPSTECDRCKTTENLEYLNHHIVCTKLWTDEEFEMLAVEIKSRNQKLTWEIVGMYRAPNEYMRDLERLVARTGGTSNTAKRSIIGGDLICRR